MLALMPPRGCKSDPQVREGLSCPGDPEIPMSPARPLHRPVCARRRLLSVGYPQDPGASVRHLIPPVDASEAVRTAMCGLRIPHRPDRDRRSRPRVTVHPVQPLPRAPRPRAPGHPVALAPQGTGRRALGRAPRQRCGGSGLPGAGLAGDAAPRPGPVHPRRAGFRAAGTSRTDPRYHHDPAPPRPRLSRPVPSRRPRSPDPSRRAARRDRPVLARPDPPHHRTSAAAPDRYPRRTNVLVPPAARAPRRDLPRDRPAPRSPHRAARRPRTGPPMTCPTRRSAPRRRARTPATVRDEGRQPA